MKNFKRFVLENKIYDDFYVIYDNDRYVYHITSLSNANKIIVDGFKTGDELNIAEKRKSVYFADKDVNYGIYARNQEGEIYFGEDIGKVKVNIKGLKLLNMTYKENGIYTNHKKYSSFVVRGELEKIPYDIDGTISYIEDGRIYEVCLYKDVANKLLK